MIIYYGSNGIEVGDTLRKHIRLIDFDHLYLINRLKYTMLRVLLESSIANEQVVAKLKIKIPI